MGKKTREIVSPCKMKFKHGAAKAFLDIKLNIEWVPTEPIDTIQMHNMSSVRCKFYSTAFMFQLFEFGPRAFSSILHQRILNCTWCRDTEMNESMEKGEWLIYIYMVSITMQQRHWQTCLWSKQSAWYTITHNVLRSVCLCVCECIYRWMGLVNVKLQMFITELNIIKCQWDASHTNYSKM